MPLRIGDTFAGYRILRLLGSGGMGEVYVVQHPRLPRQDALKVLRADVSGDTSFRERFIREADLAADLRHPHIVGIHDRGEHDGQLWIAMDYIDGTDAAELMHRYPAGMPPELVIPIVTAVSSALDYAHKKGLLHRDVKPANIIVADLDSDSPNVFLADFGIARPLDDTSGITTTNMTVGTVAYAAPEQLMGEIIDGRADEYALAATSYHLLTGSQPFPHTNPAVVISRHLNTAPPRLGDHRSDLAGFDVALQTALAKDPVDRYLTCTTFAQRLQGGSHGHNPVSPSALTQAAPRRNQLPIQSLSGSAGDDSRQRKSPIGSRTWIVGITAAATVLLIGIGVLADRALTGSEPVATQTTSAVTQSTVTLPTEPSTSTVSSASVTSPSSTSSRAVEATPSPSALPTTTVVDKPPDEQGFLAAVSSLPMYIRLDRYGGDAGLLAQGYRACAAFDQYPNDAQRATRIIYPKGTDIYGGITMDADMFMLYSASYLCPRHAHLYDNY